MPGLLLIGWASGVLAADRFLGPPATADLRFGSPAGVCVLAAIVLAVAIAAQDRSRRGGGRLRLRPAFRGPGGRLLGFALCLVLAALGGHVSMSQRLSQAARDAALAAAESDPARESPRLVEARVVSQRSSRWGVEVVLAEVRAIDSGGPVPGRLLLSVRERGPNGRGDLAGPQRADGSRPARLLRQGARLRLAVRIQPLHALRNPGTPDRDRSWARQGVAARARLLDPSWLMVVEDETSRLASWSSWRRGSARLEGLRSAWTERFRLGLSRLEVGRGLVQALSLGDRSALSEDVRSALRALGLSHLIAVSGLHVGLVGGLAGTVVSLLLGRRVRLGAGCARRFGPGASSFGLSLCGAAAAGVLYAWSTGASTSSLRAALLLALFALSRLARRSLAPGQALVWIALALLVVDPASLFDLGAQLSFGACAALVLSGLWRGDAGLPSASSSASPPPGPSASPDSGGPVATSRARWASGLADTFRGSLAVSLATTPIAATAGLPIGPASPLFNLVAIPWTAAILLPSSLGATLASPWLPGDWLRLLALPARWTEQAVVAIARALPAGQPLDAMPLEIAAGVGLAGLLAIRRRRSGIALLAWLVLASVGVPPGPSGSGLPERPRVVFFDMGQGDAALVESEQARMLVDSGGGSPDGTGGAALHRALRALGISSLDVLVVTHGDLDHRGGALRILERMPVGELWLPDGGQADQRLAPLASLAASRAIRVRWLAARAAPIAVADLEVDLLWPALESEQPGEPLRRPPHAGSWNDGSLVMRVAVAGTRILFAADVGRAVEARLSREPARAAAEILKLGHHGSRHSTSGELLRVVSPTWALVSAPCDPTRGLPNAEVLARLDATGIPIGWTGRDGAVTVALGSDGSPRRIAGWGPRRSYCRGSGAKGGSGRTEADP